MSICLMLVAAFAQDAAKVDSRPQLFDLAKNTEEATLPPRRDCTLTVRLAPEGKQTIESTCGSLLALDSVEWPKEPKACKMTLLAKAEGAGPVNIEPDTCPDGMADAARKWLEKLGFATDEIPENWTVSIDRKR